MSDTCKFNPCGRQSRTRGLCNGHHLQLCRGKGPLKRLRSDISDAERFWAKVDKENGTECWLWTASQGGKGYGRFRTKSARSMVSAHRWSYEDANGPIAEGLQIDHICRVKLCVNPDHLRSVTNKENQENLGLRRDNSSGVRGVTWNVRDNRWHVKVGHNGRRYHGGYFTEFDAACLAAVELRNQLFTHNDTDAVLG
jgi:hypothetical protein